MTTDRIVDDVRTARAALWQAAGARLMEWPPSCLSVELDRR